MPMSLRLTPDADTMTLDDLLEAVPFTFLRREDNRHVAAGYTSSKAREGYLQHKMCGVMHFSSCQPPR